MFHVYPYLGRWFNLTSIFVKGVATTTQYCNIYHLGKSNIIFKSALGRDMLVPKRLTTFPWKMVVGRLLPFWVSLYFSGPVSFGEVTSQFCRDDISCGWVFSVSPWRCILKQKHTEMTDLEWFGCKDQREGIRGTESPNFFEAFGCLYNDMMESLPQIHGFWCDVLTIAFEVSVRYFYTIYIIYRSLGQLGRNYMFLKIIVKPASIVLRNFGGLMRTSCDLSRDIQ